MKKILAGILTLTLALSLLLPIAALAQEEPADLLYIYGGASNKSRAKLKTMGQQSWYMMYSTQTNAGEAIDLSTFKECAQTETGMWKPDEVVEIMGFDPAQPDKAIAFHADWFNIRKDGFLTGDTGFSAAVKWVCEQDGVYDVTGSYSGGSSAGYAEEAYHEANGSYIAVSDGVYMSMFIKGERMFCEDTWEGEGRRIPQTEIDYPGVALKAGDEIWLVTDTKYSPEVEKQFRLFVDTAVDNGYEDVLSRVIVQIYYKEMYGEVRAVYPFENILLTLYYIGYPPEESGGGKGAEGFYG